MPARLIDYYNLGKKLHLAGPDVTDTSLGETTDDVPDERALREILKLIERISPPSLVVNRDYQIVHLSASAEKYLQFGNGESSRELLRVIHPHQSGAKGQYGRTEPVQQRPPESDGLQRGRDYHPRFSVPNGEETSV